MSTPPPTPPTMTSIQTPRVAFALSLTGGLLILLRGLLIVASLPISRLTRLGSVSPILGAVIRSLGALSLGGLALLVILAILLGLASGIIMVLGATMLEKDSERRKTWGILIIIFAAVSILTFSGSLVLIGALLGMVGGALALVRKNR